MTPVDHGLETQFKEFLTQKNVDKKNEDSP